jgi:hypothetical protein
MTVVHHFGRLVILNNIYYLSSFRHLWSCFKATIPAVLCKSGLYPPLCRCLATVQCIKRYICGATAVNNTTWSYYKVGKESSVIISAKRRTPPLPVRRELQLFEQKGKMV